MINKKNLNVHVVTHTHWDREWYTTYEIFRKRLLNLIDSLIDRLQTKNEFKYFMLDGQVVVLEDYLEMRPEKKEELKKVVNKGRVSVGPWYILPDEFLITGESFIRNYLIGKAVLDKLNLKSMNIGYLPDMFGHNAYTPTILKGLGFQAAVVWRGVGKASRDTEFLWKSPDSSTILTVNLIRSYSNGAHFGKKIEELKERYKKEISELSKKATTNNILIMNGTDHEMPYYELPKYFPKWSEEFNVNIFHSTLEDYVESIKKENPELKIVFGELKDPTYEPILKDVTSTRIYLKLKNFEAQLLYQRYIEPISTYFFSELKEKLTEIEYGWKQILKSQPHDSICGCSIDRVHRDVESRLSSALEVGVGILGDYFDKLKKGKKGSTLLVFNPYERERIAVIKGIVNNLEPQKGYVIVDDEGNEYEVDIERLDFQNAPNSLYQYGDNDYLKYLNMISNYINEKSVNGVMESIPVEISFEAKLPALGFKRFYIKEKDKTKNSSKDFSQNFENEYYKFDLNSDGSFKILDKVNEIEYSKMNLYHDVADAGDEYNFSPVIDDTPINNPKKVSLNKIKDNYFAKEISLNLEYELPKSLSEDRRKRVEEKVIIPIELKYILFKDFPRIDIKAKIRNYAKDHKFLTTFSIPEKIDKVINNGYFGIVEHPTYIENVDEKTFEEIVPRYAMESFVALKGKKAKVLLVTRGLHEYETFKHETHTDLYITLIRSVGWLSRGDLITRKGHAGPYLPTPEAQCLGTFQFRYSLFLLKEASPGELYRYSQQFLLDPVVIQATEFNLSDSSLSFFEMEEGIFLSALKISQKGDSIIARFFNVEGDSKKITFKRPVVLTNMAETLEGGLIKEYTLKPFEVLTVKLFKKP